MKKNSLSTTGGMLSLTAASASLLAILFLPEQIPVSWGVNNEVAYGSKYWLLLVGAAPFAVFYGMGAIRLIDPKKENYKKFEGAFSAVRLLATAFMFFMLLVTIINAFWPSLLDMSVTITLFTGLLIGLMGNYMPKLRHNFFCGIRTPWTLASEACWVKTHRLAGKLWVISGLLICAAAFLLKGAWLYYAITAVALIFDLAIPFVYSLIVYKKISASKQNGSE